MFEKSSNTSKMDVSQNFPREASILILHLIQSTLFHNLPEPVKALFLYSFLVFVIHVHKAKLVS